MALWLLPGYVVAQAPLSGDEWPEDPAFTDQYVLQVGAFADSENAARLLKDLRQKGFPILTRSKRDAAGKTLTLVLAGPYADQDGVLSAKTTLEAGGLSGFVRTAAVSVQATSYAQNRPASVEREVPDAAVPDAAVPDAAVPDAAVPDAAVPDAAVPDSAVPDSAVPDAEAPVSEVPESRVTGAGSDLRRDQAQLIAQTQQDLFEVPPVMERPLGMDEGPRVVVRRFTLAGAVDREKQGLRVSDLQAILGGHVRSQPADGYTINQLQNIADEISLYYRERGFFIAQAIVPAQEVRDGIVTLQILEGSLEDVRVEGNSVYKARVIEGPFRQLRGYPVTLDTIERALLDVQEFPGLTVFGTFTKGDQIGNTDLVIRVREEDRFSVTPSVDNYGSEFTGEYRAMINFEVNNLFGFADQTTGYVLQTFDPSDGTYGGLGFEFPFGRNSIGFGGSHNQFDVGGLAELTDLGVEGTVEQAEIYWKRSFANGRFFSANGRLGVAVKSADTDIPGTTLAEDNLAVASLVFDVFYASQKGRGFTVGSVGIDVGMPDTLGSMDGSGDGNSSRRGGDGEIAGGSFEKYWFNVEYLRPLGANNRVLVRLDGQYTDDILVSLEQYSIGGPRNVRAYMIAEALADTGASATLEWIINAPGFSDKQAFGGRTWGEIFQVSLYADYAYGELNNPRITEEETVDYSGYGLGLQFNVPGSLYARFDIASPIGSRDAFNDRDPQYYFRTSYTF